MDVASAYFAYDVDAPPPQVARDLIRNCEAERLDLVIGSDANSHHTVRGSTDCSVRAKNSLEYLGTTNLDILNIGCKATFKNGVIREEFINIAFTSARVWSRLRA